MADSDVNKVIEEFSHLPPEDKEYVAEIIGKQLIEVKRERLAQRARKARKRRPTT
jgi:chaperonin cofactor prefoldin